MDDQRHVILTTEELKKLSEKAKNANHLKQRIKQAEDREKKKRKRDEQCSRQIEENGRTIQ